MMTTMTTIGILNDFNRAYRRVGASAMSLDKYTEVKFPQGTIEISNRNAYLLWLNYYYKYCVFVAD